METVTIIEARDVVVICPNCKGRLEGFIGDPRGHEVECDYCGDTFKIHADADIEMFW